MEKEATRFITLTTDWGNQDYYLGMLSGKLYSIADYLKVVELSHNVPAFNYAHAAFILKHSFTHFPEGTIHICMVNSDSTERHQMLVFEYAKHYFVVPDNGTISLITEEIPSKVYGIPTDNTNSFGSLEGVTLAVGMLLLNNGLDEFALEATAVKKLTPIRPVPEKDGITGRVIYIDSYQNAITNIFRNEFDDLGRGRRFTIYVQSFSNGINRLYRSYQEAEDGELIALFNSLDLLEIAIKNGHLAQMYNLSVNSSIMVRFYNDEKLLTL